MSAPVGIQLRRTRGWRLPAGAVSVARPTRWGNPYVVGDPITVTGDCMGEGAGFYDPNDPRVYQLPLPGSGLSAEQSVALYEADLRSALADSERRAREELRSALRSLAGHDLACWCALDQPCHRNPLLEIANSL